MPELPEVQTVVEQLAPLLRGRTVRRLQVFDPKLSAEPPNLVRGCRIRDVTRAGKQIAIRLRGPGRTGVGLWLCFHLRMTGRLIWSDAARSAREPHLRARLVLDEGSVSFFDTRRLGVMRIVRALDEAVPAGIDPLSDEFTARDLAGMLSGSRQALKPWLMRQDRLAGIGNLYASEILFASRQDPFRAAGSLTPAEVRCLHAATRRVLRKAVKCCGTTFSDFRNARGLNGSYQSCLAVYGREEQPCRRCGTPIVRVVQQQRSTFFCPGCQQGR